MTQQDSTKKNLKKTDSLLTIKELSDEKNVAPLKTQRGVWLKKFLRRGFSARPSKFSRGFQSLGQRELEASIKAEVAVMPDEDDVHKLFEGTIQRLYFLSMETRQEQLEMDSPMLNAAGKTYGLNDNVLNLAARTSLNSWHAILLGTNPVIGDLRLQLDSAFLDFAFFLNYISWLRRTAVGDFFKLRNKLDPRFVNSGATLTPTAFWLLEEVHLNCQPNSKIHEYEARVAFFERKKAEANARLYGDARCRNTFWDDDKKYFEGKVKGLMDNWGTPFRIAKLVAENDARQRFKGEK